MGRGDPLDLFRLRRVNCVRKYVKNRGFQAFGGHKNRLCHNCHIQPVPFDWEKSGLLIGVICNEIALSYAELRNLKVRPNYVILTSMLCVYTVPAHHIDRYRVPQTARFWSQRILKLRESVIYITRAKIQPRGLTGLPESNPGYTCTCYWLYQ